VRGRDVQDADVDLNETEARFDMGDPMHGRPAVVIYGGTSGSPDVNDAVLYSPTNDGMLHSIDVGTGDELWSFMPVDHLNSIADIYLSTIVNLKHYGLDSEIRVLKYDVDQDGVVESGDGDRVYLYFGQGRGGSNYYAIDVTNRNRPRHLWTIGPAQLPGIGQTWSAPIVSRVNISGATQNSQKLVLIFGGGYDDTQDNAAYNTDTSGNGVYMVDAVTGALLWRASNAGANSNLTRMVHAISSNIAVLDLDGDTYADRMYAGDIGGLLWRFDIYNGNPTDSLVTGGVIADLGSASMSAPRPQSETRRMYNTPDVALMRRRGRATFFNIGIGTGYRGHPLNVDTHDRFYAVRDYMPFNKRTQLEYDALVPYTDADMVDVTTNLTPSIPDNGPGWKMELRLPGGWVGEKVLAESRTFNNTIFFPTYLPNNGVTTACQPAAGRNRVYIVSAYDAAPVLEQDGVATDANGDGTAELTIQDRYSPLDQSGIAPETIMLFPGGGAGAGGGGGTDPVVCLNGAEVLGACTNFNSRLRTFWRESAAN
jgi:type IV pilus assembly protein PilY1